MNLKGYEQIADYVWLKKGLKYWNIMDGNPFCAGLIKIPIGKATREQLIKQAKINNEEERVRFAEMFPDIEWISL
jgi:hypothetical protein